MHPPVPNPTPGFDYPAPAPAPAPVAPTPPAQDVGGPVQGPPSPSGQTAPQIQLQDKNYQAAVQTAQDELNKSRQDVINIQKNIDDTKAQIAAIPGGINAPG